MTPRKASGGGNVCAALARWSAAGHRRLNENDVTRQPSVLLADTWRPWTSQGLNFRAHLRQRDVPVPGPPWRPDHTSFTAPSPRMPTASPRRARKRGKATYTPRPHTADGASHALRRGPARCHGTAPVAILRAGTSAVPSRNRRPQSRRWPSAGTSRRSVPGFCHFTNPPGRPPPPGLTCTAASALTVTAQGRHHLCGATVRDCVDLRAD